MLAKTQKRLKQKASSVSEFRKVRAGQARASSRHSLSHVSTCGDRLAQKARKTTILGGSERACAVKPHPIVKTESASRA